MIDAAQFLSFSIFPTKEITHKKHKTKQIPKQFSSINLNKNCQLIFQLKLIIINLNSSHHKKSAALSFFPIIVVLHHIMENNCKKILEICRILFVCLFYSFLLYIFFFHSSVPHQFQLYDKTDDESTNMKRNFCYFLRNFLFNGMPRNIFSVAQLEGNMGS